MSAFDIGTLQYSSSYMQALQALLHFWAQLVVYHKMVYFYTHVKLKLCCYVNIRAVVVH